MKNQNIRKQKHKQAPAEECNFPVGALQLRGIWGDVHIKLLKAQSMEREADERCSFMLEENTQLKVQMNDLSSKFIDNLRVMTVGETESFKMQELLDQLHEQQISLKTRNEYLG